jgi:hypothetical protein
MPNEYIKGPNKKNCICEGCGKAYQYIWDGKKSINSNSKKKCNSCHANGRRFKLKEKIIEYLGGKCLACGYKKCSRSLDCHHKDPNKKEFHFAGKHCLSWDRLEKELKKCTLLCRNCHGELHAGLISLENILDNQRYYSDLKEGKLKKKLEPK